MLAFLGSAGVVSALAGAIVLVVRGIRVARGGSSDLVAPGRLVLSGAVIAMAAMELALLNDDFSLAYVANHHATTTPFPFDVATAWAALEGSIILWGLVLAVFIWATTLKYRNSPDRLGAAALAVMGGVAIFFFGLMVTVSNPFEVCVEALSTGCAASSPWPLAAADVPANGPGPNALLQNHFLMAIHPPVLYVGYVGLTVPFAYAIGALSLGVPGPEWLKRSHRSTLVAWSFLTLGIILGGWWAYEVLSWGGYWAWDPVENASLLPWLVATAFIHSGLVQQRRGMLQAWNFVLVISAFALTILGTFLTRSGTINSVHSFTQSAIGPALLGFMVLVLVGSFTLFSMRSHLVATSPRIQSFVSREGSFLVNNLLLAVYAFVVLIGTTYPLLLEAFTGTQVGVGEPFFNRLAVPLSFLLLLTMGFGPVTPWRGAAPGLLWRRLRGPTIIALAAGIVTALVVTRVGWVVLAVTLGLFVSSAILGLLLELARSRTEKSGRPLPTEIRTVLGNDQSFWAGQLSHVGVVLVAVGIAFAANLPAHLQVELAPGDSVDFAGYTLVYDSPFRRNEPNRVVQGARIDVLKEDRRLTTLEPRLNLYQAMATAVITPAVMTQAEGDLYLTLRRIDADTIDLDLDTSPMIWLIWLGGLTTAAGGFWSLAVRRTERAAERDRVVANV